MNINMSRLKFINETVINDTNNIKLLESKIKTLENKVDKLRLEDKRLKNFNCAKHELYPNENIPEPNYNTKQIEEIKKQLVKHNKTIRDLKNNIKNLTEEKETLDKCDQCNKIDWTYCYKELNLIQISDNKFKCDKCSDILHCDCYDCYNKTNTTGTFRKLLDKYNILTDNINNDTIQLEVNNNLLNNSIIELNELNILQKWNNNYPKLFDVNNDINIRIINISNIISSTQNNVNDLSTNIKNNEKELSDLSKQFNKDCLHFRGFYHSSDSYHETHVASNSYNRKCFIRPDNNDNNKLQCKYCHNIFIEYTYSYERDSY